MSEGLHETQTPSGITIPDPDQGTPCILVNCAMPSTMFEIWEPFEDGTPGGHNLFGFLRRWEEWAAGSELFLICTDVRFGHPMALPRAILGDSGAVGISINYHRREDARAGVRSGAIAVPGQPMARSLGNGVVQVDIPLPRGRRHRG